MLVGVPPVGDELFAGGFGSVGGDDPPVPAVGRDGVGGVTVAELVERVDLPAVLLAAVVVELDGGQPRGEGAEQAAGVDLGQLVRVPDEDHLHVAGLGLGEQAGELASADHPRLVRDQYRTRGERRSRWSMPSWSARRRQ